MIRIDIAINNRKGNINLHYVKINKNIGSKFERRYRYHLMATVGKKKKSVKINKRKSKPHKNKTDQPGPETKQKKFTKMKIKYAEKILKLILQTWAGNGVNTSYIFGAH